MYGGVSTPPFRAAISEYPWWQSYVQHLRTPTSPTQPLTTKPFPQLPQQHNPRIPIPPPPLSIRLHKPSMSPLPRLRIPQSSRPANLRRRLQFQSIRLRRFLLRPLRRRRHHPRPPQQRMETRSLHQSPFTRRPQRLRRLQLRQPKHHHRCRVTSRFANSLARCKDVVFRSFVPALSQGGL